MKTVLGLVLIIAGVLIGLYVGGYLMFIQGIIQIIEQVKAETMEASVVAWGLAKVVFASFIGWLAAIGFIIPGRILLD